MVMTPLPTDDAKKRAWKWLEAFVKEQIEFLDFTENEAGRLEHEMKIIRDALTDAVVIDAPVNDDGFDKFVQMLEREPQYKPRLAALLKDQSIEIDAPIVEGLNVQRSIYVCAGCGCPTLGEKWPDNGHLSCCPERKPELRLIYDAPLYAQGRTQAVPEYPVWVCTNCNEETCGDDPYMKVDGDDGETDDVCRHCLQHNSMIETGEYKRLSAAPPVTGGAEYDLSKCPKCQGEADNGHDRCIPPTPYLCTKCAPPSSQTRGG